MYIFFCVATPNISHNYLKIKSPLKYYIDQKIKVSIGKPHLGKEKDKSYPNFLQEQYGETIPENISETLEQLRNHCSLGNAEVHCELIFLFIFMSHS